MKKTTQKEKFQKSMNVVMAIMMAIMAILVFFNVVLRYGFHSGINGSEEIARLLFVWVSFIGAVAAMASRGHLGVDIVLKRLALLPRRLVGLLGRLVIIAVLLVMLWGCWQQMVINNDTLTSGVIAYPMSWPYAAGVFASVGCLIFAVVDVIKLIRGDVSCLSSIEIEEEVANAEQFADEAKRHLNDSDQ